MTHFKKNEDGATLVFVGVCLAVLMGFAALTFDLGRVAATQSDMQAYADHVALAAAGQLDGSPGSRQRAREMAEGAIQDRQVFGDLDTQVLDGTNDFTLRFLKALPDTDREYWAPDDLNDPKYLAANDFEATMVEVTTRTESIFQPFFRAFGALSGNDVGDGRTTVFARAVAGYTQYACDIATLMFCLPSDKSKLDTGNSVRLRSGGQNEPWGPGNFGFLDPSDDAIDPNGFCADLTGSSKYQCLIASSGNRTRCFAQRGVDMNTGQGVGIENAVFNTRFDIYTSTLNNSKDDPIYAPALHRVSGYASGNGNNNDGAVEVSGQCLGNQVTPSANSMAFPPDICHANDCGAFGGKDWDRDAYVAKNYGNSVTESTSESEGTSEGEEAPDSGSPPTFNSLRKSGGNFYGLPEFASRYEVYKAEHEAAIPGSGTGQGSLTPNFDFSGGTCATTTPSLNPNRRVFIAAGIDCAANAINGAKKGVPVEGYYEVFLMGPVGMENGGSGNFDLNVEMIGTAGGDGSGDDDDGGIFRVVVELLR